MTWPQGMVSMALRPLERAFLQEGHIREGEGSEGEGLEDTLMVLDDEVVKVTGIRVFSESGWGDVSEEAGQKGWSLGGFVDDEVCVVVKEGVKEGTQKEGSVGSEA